MGYTSRSRRSSRQVFTIAAILTLAAQGVAAHAAATYDWWIDPGTSGALENPANYRLNSSGDTVAPTTAPDINSTPGVTVDFSRLAHSDTTMLVNANQTLLALNALTGVNTIDMQHHALTISKFTVTDDGTGGPGTTLTLANGTLFDLGTLTLGSSRYSSGNSTSPNTATLNLSNGGVASTNTFLGTSLIIIGLSGGKGIVNVNSNGSQLTSGTNQTWIGSGIYSDGTNVFSSNGTLNLTNGGTASASDFFVGKDGGTGTVTVDGNGSVLLGSLEIGRGNATLGNTTYASNGSLVITNSGMAETSDGIGIGLLGGTGSATVDGAGSLIHASKSTISVGEEASIGGIQSTGSVGTLSITHGGSVQGDLEIDIANSGATGVVTVDGTGSKLQSANGSLNIASDATPTGNVTTIGSGTLTLTHGGHAIAYSGIAIGSNFGIGNVTVDGVGSTLQTITNEIDIGGGTLSVTNGGTVICPSYFRVESSTPSATEISQNCTVNIGSATPNANSTLTIGGGLTVGLFLPDKIVPSVTLNINTDGTITVAGTTETYANFSLVSINLNGGTLQTQSLSLAAANHLNWTSGTLSLNGGRLSSPSALTIPTAGILAGTGTLAEDILNSGTIAPGNSPGTLSFSGNLTEISSSDLQMQLAGTDNTLVDRLIVNGLLTFDGTLDVSLLNYTPQLNDHFDLFDFNASLGHFATLDLPTLSPGLAWDSSALYTTGVLSVVPAPEPASLALLLLPGLFIARRRTRT